jgi:MSHA biogenesis protein MshP
MSARQTIRGLQRGFSLVTAIFLLVVLGALGTMMMTFFSAQQQSSALDVVGVRAYQAARAGIEWGAFQVLQSGVGCAPSSTVALGGKLAPFNVTVACQASAYSEAAATVTVYQLTSTAKYGGSPGQADYVERVIDATFAK